MADAITQLQQHLVFISFDMAKCIGTIFHESGELKAENGQIQDFDPSNSKELAQNIIKKIMQNDILISSLPKSFSTEQQQLEQIEQLLKRNAEIDQQLIDAKEKAKDVQTQISNRLLNLSNDIYESNECKDFIYLNVISTNTVSKKVKKN